MTATVVRRTHETPTTRAVQQPRDLSGLTDRHIPVRRSRCRVSWRGTTGGRSEIARQASGERPAPPDENPSQPARPGGRSRSGSGRARVGGGGGNGGGGGGSRGRILDAARGSGTSQRKRGTGRHMLQYNLTPRERQILIKLFELSRHSKDEFEAEIIDL